MGQVAYYALITMDLGDRVVQPGDLIPEANGWAHLGIYLHTQKVAPVLVRCLPEAEQARLKKLTAAAQS